MFKNYPLLVSIFFSGACLMIVEVAGARIMAPYLGTTIFVWAATIGAVLASLSLGYYAGGVLADRYKRPFYLSLIFFAAATATFAIPFVMKTLLPFTDPLDVMSASIIASMILIPASFCYGMVSPFAIMLSSSKGREGRSAGGIFAISTVGSIVGTLSTGFILVPSMGLSSIFFLASLLMLICGAILLRFLK